MSLPMQRPAGLAWLLARLLTFLLAAWLAPAQAAPQFCPAGVQVAAGMAPLKVGVKYAPPFVMENDKKGWQGLAVEMWETIALCLGTRHEYIEFATTEELLAAIEKHDVDVGVGALSITSAREQRVDFSHPYYTGSLGAIVRDVTQARGFLDVLKGFLRPEVVLIVLGLVLSTVLIAYTYWRVEGPRGNRFFGDGPARGFYNATLWAVQLVFSGRGDPFEVQHRAGQLFVLFLTFFGVTIVSGVTAIITSSLTLQGIEWRIQNVADLKKLDLGVMITGQARDWALRERLYVKQLRSWPEVQRRFDEKSIDAFVHDRDILLYLVKDGYLKDVRVEPLSFMPEGYGLAVASGSPLREPIDTSLLAVQEDGVWAVLMNKYLGSR
ncbi:MAG TPA: transporter substrate-binding domain-containing protein [Burkholderiaceae bacterium]|nr:transporter substrate-binding domain-containing protein [Burkholderiaceae bacterium]